MKAGQRADDTLRLSSEEQRQRLMVQAAKAYYDLGRTQSEIAEDLSLNRWQVGRLLRDARDAGIVRIEINPPTPRAPDLEAAVQRQFGLRDAVVVPAPSDDRALTLDAVATEAARFLNALHPKPGDVGVSWGRTMTAVARRLPHRWNEGVRVVLLNGATTLRSGGSLSNTVAEQFAVTGGGEAWLLPLPAILGSSESRRVLERDPIVGQVMRMARETPFACFGIGLVSGSSVLVESGYLTDAEVADLGARGAVGDILGRFVDAQGEPVDRDLDDRTVGLPLAALREKPLSIAVAAQADKARAVRACLAAGYANVLICDAATARLLVEDPA